jgi:hypothetical protein
VQFENENAAKLFKWERKINFRFLSPRFLGCDFRRASVCRGGQNGDRGLGKLLCILLKISGDAWLSLPEFCYAVLCIDCKIRYAAET